jgi:hypothetical protein
MTWIFVIANAVKQSRCHCEHSEAISSSLRPPSQYHKIAASASPPRNDMIFCHCERSEAIPLSLRAQRSNPVVLATAVATPQDYRVGFASSP